MKRSLLAKIWDFPALIGAHLAKAFLTIPGVRTVAPDAWYLRARFRIKMNRPLRLWNPITFNEKLQWLKLRATSPTLTKLVDKYEVRQYIANKVGTEHLVPLLGGPWKSFNEIDFQKLPDKFVLKATHDSGGIVIVKDKKTFNLAKARRKLSKALRRNFYWVGRETPYRDIEPRIIAELCLEDEADGGLRDYKLFVFNGKTRLVIVCSNRFSKNSELHVTFYDENWNLLPFERHYPREISGEPAPKAFDALKRLAETLAENLPLARVDFYLHQDKIYVGEITLFPGSGVEPFEPDEWDEIIGGWLKLPL